MNSQRTAGHDPWSTICPELVVLNVSGHLTGANQHSGPGISGTGLRVHCNSRPAGQWPGCFMQKGPQAFKPTSLTGYKLLWYRNL